MTITVLSYPRQAGKTRLIKGIQDIVRALDDARDGTLVCEIEDCPECEAHRG